MESGMTNNQAAALLKAVIAIVEKAETKAEIIAEIEKLIAELKG